MKRLPWLLLFLVLLTGCSRDAVVLPTPPELEITMEETPLPSDPEPELLPAPEETPPPAEETDPLPPLPNSVYCTGDTAVDAHGKVLLQLPEHTLSPLYDSVTGQLRAIIAVRNFRAAALYDLSGQLLLEDLNAVSAGLTGDLFWYRGLGSTTLVRLSDQTVLEDNLALVEPIGSMVAIQPSFWTVPCTLLNHTGTPAQELDHGFRLIAAYRENAQTWLAMEAIDNTQILINADGQVCLPQFYTEVLGISQGCALVRQDDRYLAVDLTSGEIRMEQPVPFTYLGRSILAETGPDGEKSLLDLTGNTLFSNAMPQSYSIDADQNGVTDLVLCQILQDRTYATTVLTASGTILCTLPTQLEFVQPLSPTELLYTTPSGNGYTQTALLRNLTDGTEQTLCTGSYLAIEPIQTTQGQFFLCRSSHGADQTEYRLLRSDGTQVLPVMSRCTYAGGDVFDCATEAAEGLLCLTGTWLYQV